MVDANRDRRPVVRTTMVVAGIILIGAIGTTALTQVKKPTSSVKARSKISQATSTNSVIEFDAEEIRVALRTLARQAGIRIVVSDKAATECGTVTMRLQGKTALQAID